MVVGQSGLATGGVATVNVSGITAKEAYLGLSLVGCHNTEAASGPTMNNPPHGGRQDLPARRAGFVFVKFYFFTSFLKFF